MVRPPGNFYELLAATVTSAIANTQAFAETRRRAEALAELDRSKTVFFSNISHGRTRTYCAGRP